MVLSFIGLFFIPCDRKQTFEHYQRKKQNVKLVRVIIYGTDAKYTISITLKLKHQAVLRSLGL
jgi:hypothetical protein